MKASIDRANFDAGKRYSRVLQQQGRMITASDLNEAAALARSRSEDMGRLAIRDGVPEAEGVITLTLGGDGLGEPSLIPALQPGLLVADGVIGAVQAANGWDDEKALDLLNHQRDLPNGVGEAFDGTGGARLVYADVWHRTILPFEDPDMTDKGLHDAETAVREQVMAQLKVAPAADLQVPDGADAHRPRLMPSRYPARGTARLSLSAPAVDAELDACDPCAQEVRGEQRVQNALLRIEVIDILGTVDKPEGLKLAWSRENGAVVAPLVEKASLDMPGLAAYEVFAPRTEMAAGPESFKQPHELPTFFDRMQDVRQPSGEAERDWYIRRWDGYAEIRFKPEPDTFGARMGAAPGIKVDVAARRLALSFEEVTATLDFAGQSAMRGDYWLIELRRFRTPSYSLVGGDADGTARPHGVQHHYLPLFRVTAAGKPLPLTHAEHRRLTFPALEDMHATHVAFESPCPRYEGVETVHEALEALCDIPASTVSFVNQCGESEPFGDASTVQEALNALCGRFDVQEHDHSSLLRLLFDWGVVCGVRVTGVDWERQEILVGAGHILTPRGKLMAYGGGRFTVTQLTAAGVLDGMRLNEEREDVALVLQETDDGLSLRLMDAPGVWANIADFRRYVERCKKGRKKFQIGDIRRALGEREQKLVGDMLFMAQDFKTFEGGTGVSNEDAEVLKAFNAAMMAKWEDTADDKDVEEVRAHWATVDDRFSGAGLSLDQAAIKRMDREAAKAAVIIRKDAARLRACECEFLYPPCPPEIALERSWVPITGLRVRRGRNGPILSEVCERSMRKTAITPRTYSYYLYQDFITRTTDRLDVECCWTPPRLPPLDDIIIPKPERPPYLEFPPRPPWSDPPEDPPWVLPPRWPGVTPLPGWGGGPLVNPGADPWIVHGAGDDITRFNTREAEDFLAGKGVKVTQKITLGEGDMLGTLKAKSSDLFAMASDKTLRAGDHVALTLRDGKPAGYVVLERNRPVHETTTERQAAETAITELSARVEKIAEGKAATVTVNGSRLSVDELLGEVEKAKALKGELEGDIAGLRANLQALKVEREAVEESAVTSLGKFEEARVLRDEMRTEIVALDERLRSLKTERRVMEDAVSATSGRLSSLKDERVALEEILNVARQAKAELSGDVQALNLDVGRLRSERESVSEELKVSIASLDRLKEDRKALEVRLEAAEVKINALKTEVPTAKVKVDPSIFTLSGDQNFTNRLRARGLVKSDDLIGMSEPVLRSRGLSAADAKRTVLLGAMLRRMRDEGEG